ncbi:DMT family transporter [Albidovulum sediminicola]|uniref:DMT family transporter n=1 Tax=Albidovulum sediminicola TaxID=2984331 RepID=A0ABT2Z5K3_9RHOB|nr:DMT family transporter [Defluviimonas sp. WL0075]MCV2866305.1 DMT family transporter [Defluviimonas sp. WL0075]
MSPAASSHAAMLIVSALVAGSFSLGAMAAPHMAPIALTAVRFVVAAVALWAFLRVRREEAPARAYRAVWRYVVLGGLFSLYFVLMFEGLRTAAPVSASAVYATTPLVTAGFGLLLLRQRPTPRSFVAMSIAALGALWVVFRADIAALLAFRLGRGEAVYFLGCVAHSLYIPLIRMLNRGETALVFTLGTVMGATLALIAAGLPALIATNWAALPPIVWVTIVYTALFATATSFALTQFASLRIPAANVMAYTYLVPVWVIAWEFALGAGGAPAMILPGIGLIVIALLAMLGEDDREPQGRGIRGRQGKRAQ